MAELPVLIVGAGIGGATLGAALTRVGVPFRLFEQAPELGEVGAGLGLWQNAVRVLRSLDVDESFFGTPIETLQAASYKGRVLSHHDLRPLNAELGLAAHVVHRGELHRALCERLPEGVVTLGATCTGFTQDPEGVTARFADGAQVRGRLLVGCDGIRSAVREGLLGATPMRYSGETCYRGIARYSMGEAVLREIQGPARRCAVNPLDGERVYWWAAMTAPEGEQDDPTQRLAFLQERYADWPFHMPEALEATEPDAVLRNDLHDRPPVPRWSEGRVTLLGDAAHPTTPNLGQGACMAIEDAAVLTRCLLQYSREPPAAFASYERQRLTRTTGIVNTSWRIGKIGQWKSWPAVTLRELGALMIPDFLMGHMIRQQVAYDAGPLSP